MAVLKLKCYPYFVRNLKISKVTFSTRDHSFCIYLLVPTNNKMCKNICKKCKAKFIIVTQSKNDKPTNFRVVAYIFSLIIARLSRKNIKNREYE